MDHKIYIIVATDENLGIGKNGKMPWDLKDELRHFQEITTKVTDPSKQNMVIMGRTTWLSIPEKHRPLKNRKNVVLSRESMTGPKDVSFCSSMEDAFALADSKIENIFIIGGASVYKQAVEKGIADGIYLTRIHKEYECDTRFPEIPEYYGEPVNMGGGEEDDLSYDYLFYSK